MAAGADRSDPGALSALDGLSLDIDRLIALEARHAKASIATIKRARRRESPVLIEVGHGTHARAHELAERLGLRLGQVYGVALDMLHRAIGTLDRQQIRELARGD